MISLSALTFRYPKRDNAALSDIDDRRAMLMADSQRLKNQKVAALLAANI